MKFRVNRLEPSDNIRTAPVVTGYEQVMEEDMKGYEGEKLTASNLHSMFLDYRHYYADEGGYFWPLVAVDEDGEEYFQEGNDDPGISTEDEGEE